MGTIARHACIQCAFIPGHHLSVLNRTAPSAAKFTVTTVLLIFTYNVKITLPTAVSDHLGMAWKTTEHSQGKIQEINILTNYLIFLL